MCLPSSMVHLLFFSSLCQLPFTQFIFVDLAGTACNFFNLVLFLHFGHSFIEGVAFSWSE